MLAPLESSASLIRKKKKVARRSPLLGLPPPSAPTPPSSLAFPVIYVIPRDPLEKLPRRPSTSQHLLNMVHELVARRLRLSIPLLIETSRQLYSAVRAGVRGRAALVLVVEQLGRRVALAAPAAARVAVVVIVVVSTASRRSHGVFGVGVGAAVVWAGAVAAVFELDVGA